MTEEADGHDEGGKAPRIAFKWIAAAVSVMAGVVPIVGAFEHWFDSGGGTPAEPASTVSEYAAVCNLSNARQREEERDRVRFRATFTRARNATVARDTMLLLAKQEIVTTSELQNRIQALTPTAGKASAQRSLEADWKGNLTVLGEYRERLGEGVASAAALVKLAAVLPRSSIEARSADARGRLLRLGAPACSLQAKREQPTADWSPAVRRELAAERRAAGVKGETIGASTASVSPYGGPTEVLAEGESPSGETSEVLPEAEFEAPNTQAGGIGENNSAVSPESKASSGGEGTSGTSQLRQPSLDGQASTGGGATSGGE
jgi:hypothetical protein